VFKDVTCVSYTGNNALPVKSFFKTFSIPGLQWLHAHRLQPSSFSIENQPSSLQILSIQSNLSIATVHLTGGLLNLTGLYLTKSRIARFDIKEVSQLQYLDVSNNAL
jgi:Leucine-rich repeat (LRR) protein